MAMDMNSLMNEAKKMQEKMKTAQDDLTKLEVTAEAGAGMVKIIMNGRHRIKENGGLYIAESLMNEDAEMISDLIIAAHNEAVNRIEETSKKMITNLTSGFNLPADFKLPTDTDKE